MGTIYSKRLVLRAIEKQDTSPLVSKIFTDPRVTQYIFNNSNGNSGNKLSKYKAEIYIRNNFLFKPNPYGLCVLVEKKSNNLVGIGGLLQRLYRGVLVHEFCFVIEQAQWGKGYATEISAAQIDYGLNQLQLPKVFASIHKNNRGAMNVMNKLDMKLMPDFDLGHKDWLLYVKDSLNLKKE